MINFVLGVLFSAIVWATAELAQIWWPGAVCVVILPAIVIFARIERNNRA
jgi:hypothetical protein